jgi:hypothetical protein
MLTMLGKIALASLPLVAVCAAASHWPLADWATQGLLSKTSALLATVLVGALVFIGCGALLRIEELDELFDAIKRRLRRPRR